MTEVEKRNIKGEQWAWTIAGVKQSKSGHALRFGNVARCPICTYPLLLAWIVEDQWPYAHCDFNLKCAKCGWDGTFGLATNPLFGMELIIWDSDPLQALEQAEATEPPTCPFHNKPMVLTKVWGDKVMEKADELRMQWKCPTTFLTEHKTVVRTQKPVKHAKESPPTPSKKKILDKLEALGYA